MFLIYLSKKKIASLILILEVFFPFDFSPNMAHGNYRNVSFLVESLIRVMY